MSSVTCIQIHNRTWISTGVIFVIPNHFDAAPRFTAIYRATHYEIDAATCGFGSERVMWYENDGNGNFSLHTLDKNQQSYDLRTVDMDCDGDLDLLNAGRGTSNVTWYENPVK